MMKKTIANVFVIMFYNSFLNAQSITGNFKSMVNQEITPQGFNGLQNYTIAKTKID
jgi:hypothetical protein